VGRDDSSSEVDEIADTGGAVPDNTASGASFDITVPDTRPIAVAGNNVTLTLIDISTPSVGWINPYGHVSHDDA
jgi:hypothetical protein